MLVGKGISEGIGLGKVVILKENEIKIEKQLKIPQQKNKKFIMQ